MRFTFAVALGIASSTLLPFVLGAPTTGLAPRDEVSSAVTSATGITNKLGIDLESYVTRIKADPLLELSPYVDDSRKTTYSIPTALAQSFTTALQGIASLPSLTTSSNPSEQVLNEYGPLVKAVTLSVFYTSINLKLLMEDTLGKDVPGLTDFLQAMDENSFAYTKALDAKFVGSTDELATVVGEDTPLGQAIKALGGQLFYLLFDHIPPS
ncbi:hypothetical protein IAT38_002970 [Cryptococcus sp. DSM 104549]